MRFFCVVLLIKANVLEIIVPNPSAIEFNPLKKVLLTKFLNNLASSPKSFRTVFDLLMCYF